MSKFSVTCTFRTKTLPPTNVEGIRQDLFLQKATVAADRAVKQNAFIAKHEEDRSVMCQLRHQRIACKGLLVTAANRDLHFIRKELKDRAHLFGPEFDLDDIMTKCTQHWCKLLQEFEVHSSNVAWMTQYALANPTMTENGPMSFLPTYGGVETISCLGIWFSGLDTHMSMPFRPIPTNVDPATGEVAPIQGFALFTASNYVSDVRTAAQNLRLGMIKAAREAEASKPIPDDVSSSYSFYQGYDSELALTDDEDELASVASTLPDGEEQCMSSSLAGVTSSGIQTVEAM